MSPVLFGRGTPPRLLLVTVGTPPRLLVAGVTLAVLVICQAPTAVANWQDDIMPKRQLGLDFINGQSLRFKGNESHRDHFKLLERDGTSLLIGARNIVYNISVGELTEHTSQRIEWHPSEAHRNLCLMKGKSEDDCQNYVRVLAKVDDGRVLVCGTNAYKPMCREYSHSGDGSNAVMMSERNGQGLCPYDPDHNSTAVYSNGELYVATVADFSGTDALIYRHQLRTEQYDLKHLNEPSFVGSMANGDFVYFFLRETAVEYINCGKAVYSRVARVCKSDHGGPNKFQYRWTSFLKSRLNCSIPGDYPFYFDEIQSMSSLVDGIYNGSPDQVMYGVFTTPTNSIPGSAVCAFRLQDILDTFEGQFKQQETMNANWLPVHNSKVPEPRPGQCAQDSKSLPEISLNFVKSHSLMDEAVPAFFGSPVIVRTSLRHRFTKIAVDPQVRTPDGATYDVLFIATDDGRVLKVINVLAPGSTTRVQPVIIDEVQVFPADVVIRNIMVTRATEQGQPRLLVVSDDEIKSTPVHHCDREVNSCSKCVGLQDPYCAWDKLQQRCSSISSLDWSPTSFVQNVALGSHPSCPPDQERSESEWLDAISPPDESAGVADSPCACSTVSTSTTAASLTSAQPVLRDPRREDFFPYDVEEETNRIAEALEPAVAGTVKEYDSRRQNSQFKASTLGIAIATACLAALVVGFVAGFLFSRRCRNDSSYPGAYLERQNINRCHDTNFLNCADPACPPPNNKSINLVLNVPPKNGKNANSAADNKPVQKVKKIYL